MKEVRIWWRIFRDRHIDDGSKHQWNVPVEFRFSFHVCTTSPCECIYLVCSHCGECRVFRKSR